jgi:hypothetical protein
LKLKLQKSLDRAASSTANKNHKIKNLIILLIRQKFQSPLIDLAIDKIGYLNFEFNVKKLNNLKIELYKIECNEIKYPMGVCWSGKDSSRDSKVYQYAAIDYSTCYLITYDTKFTVKNYFKISCHCNKLADTIRTMRLETNCKKIFYVLDKSSHYIYMLREKNQQEMEIFKEIAEFCKDICFFDETLYAICELKNDSNKCELKKFSPTGVFKRSLILENATFKEVINLKINKKFIAILESFNEIKLYDLSGQFRFKLNNTNTNCICFADNHLLTLDSNGDLKCCDVESLEFNLQTYRSLPKNESYFMGYFNGKIFISYPWKREFCVLK